MEKRTWVLVEIRTSKRGKVVSRRHVSSISSNVPHRELPDQKRDVFIPKIQQYREYDKFGRAVRFSKRYLALIRRTDNPKLLGRGFRYVALKLVPAASEVLPGKLVTKVREELEKQGIPFTFVVRRIENFRENWLGGGRWEAEPPKFFLYFPETHREQVRELVERLSSRSSRRCEVIEK